MPRKEYYQKHKEKYAKANKEYYWENKEKALSQNKLYRQNHKKERCENQKKYYKRNWNICRLRANKKNQANKIIVISHYSNGTMSCLKCGFSDIRALQVDHINGGGSKQRHFGHGSLFYKWLIKNNYPKGYQVLCANCNWIKRWTNNEFRK